MKHSAKAQFAILGSAIIASILTLAACGGGGTSSGAGAGGSAVASVSGTVNGGSATAFEMHPGVGPAQLFTALGDMVIPAAYAAGVPDVLVVVDCTGGGGDIYDGVTDLAGKFTILAPNIGNGSCTTAFNNIPGPNLTLTPGMETEIGVTLNETDGAVIVDFEQQVDNTPRLEIEVDDGVSNVASRSDDADSDDAISDDAISDGPSNDTVSNEDDDSQSIDQAGIDDQSSADTPTI